MSGAEEKDPYQLAHRWGLNAEACARTAILAYFQLLLAWNETINLTGARSIDQLLEGHLVDSLALARLVPPGAAVVDVGSGGGLPIVPFCLLRPDCRVCMVEPRGRRAAFLSTCIRELGLGGARLFHGRDDKVVERGFAVACSRATFEPDVWVRRAIRLLEPAGLSIVFAAQRVVVPGFQLVEALEYSSGPGTPRWAGSFRST